MATSLHLEAENGINQEIIEEMKGINQEIEVVEAEIGNSMHFQC